MKKLYLSETDRKLGGVCGGIGEYLGVDPTVIRIIYIVVTLLSAGIGVFAYILMWLVVPKKAKEKP